MRHVRTRASYCFLNRRRTPELLRHRRPPRSGGHQLPPGGEGGIQRSPVQLQDHLPHHGGKAALFPARKVPVKADWFPTNAERSPSDEDAARVHPGGVGAIRRPSHHPQGPVPEEAAGVHHARAESALSPPGVQFPQGPGHSAEAGRTGGESAIRDGPFALWRERPSQELRLEHHRT